MCFYCYIEHQKECKVPLNEDWAKNKFDIDLAFGKKGEELIASIFEGKGKIEVKTERDIWKTTGNVAIEYSCRGKPSGLSTTEADWWFHLFTIDGEMEFALLFKVLKLKKQVRTLWNKCRHVDGGDDNASKMILIPIQELL